MQPVPVALVFYALRDPTRRAIYEVLAKGEATNSELARRFSLTNGSVYQHTEALKRAGLIDGRPGRQHRTHWRAIAGGLRPLTAWIKDNS